MVLAFELDKAIIGTLRLVPMQYGLTLTEKLLLQIALDKMICHESWEVGRLVLDPYYRSKQFFLKKCLFLSLDALLKRSDAKKLFASCNYLLGRLYGRFGFSFITKNVLLENTEKVYSLICGDTPKVLHALKPKSFD